MSDGKDVKIVKGACPLDCPDTCAWEVTVEDGRAVSLRGRKDHPFTRGNLCVKVNRYLEQAALPDRLLYPLRRTGGKGAGEFERISWDAALGEIAERFQTIIKDHGGEAIWPYCGTGTIGVIQGITGCGQRLWNTLGASRHLNTICSIAGSVGNRYVTGSRNGMDPESLAQSRLILLWGTNPLTTGNHLWRFVTEARKSGAHVVVIDPIRTRSAAMADQHVAIRPGTDAALALGLLNVVVGLGAEDQDYIEANTVGWPAYRELILEYPPARVSQITTIPVAAIERLGRRLAETRPTGIRMTMGMQRHGGGGGAVRAIMSIPGVTGDWKHPGGGAAYSTGDFFQGNAAALTRPDLAARETRFLSGTKLGEGLLEADDPPVKALVVYNANPLASTPHTNRIRQGLARDDLFTVVLEQFPTDTVDYADIVLPATMQMEHACLNPSYGHLYLAWNEPAVAPPGECLANTEIFRRMARAMGLNEPSLYDSDEDLARAVLGSDHPSLRGISLETLQENGWMRLNYPQPFVPFAGGFPTASGKLEFWSERAAADGFDPLPRYVPPLEVTDPELAQRFPLALITPASHYFLNSSFANHPALAAKAGRPRIVLHPTDARQRGLEEGAEARVFNDRGDFKAVVVVSDMVRPGVAASEKGHWPKLTGEGSNNTATVAERDADMGGGAIFHDNRVEVSGLAGSGAERNS